MLGLSENGEVFQFLSNKSFPEFIDYVCAVGNEHWQPFYMHCNYCGINYEMIGRMETLDDDLIYIAQENNFTHRLLNGTSKYHLHPTGGTRFSSRKEILSKHNYDEKMKKYFS